MASNQTPHLKLSQWEADDEVVRADFNADNSKIDSAIMERFGPDNLPWVMGSYTGSADTSGGTQDISLGFKPKLLLVVGYSGSFGMAAALENTSNSVSTVTSSGTAFVSSELSLTNSGFQVKRNNSYGLSLNYQGWPYIYFALR